MKLYSCSELENLQVCDNGHGMLLSDLCNCGLPGHTSKIDSTTQIDRELRDSHGFRGEALASLSHFCQLEIATLHRHDISACAYIKVIRDGFTEKITKTLDRREPGSTIICKNLFWNRPVLRKVLLGKSRFVATHCQ
jgi:DNA mismatch repair ATPase MutL